MADPTVAKRDVILNLNYLDSRGKALKKSFRYAKQNVTDAAVKNLMDGIIENGTLFNTVPYEKVSADMAITSRKSFDVLDD